MKITYKALQAAVLCCAKNDVRQNLEGVNVTGKNISSTDGHILFNYNDEYLNNLDYMDVIIPSEAIINFVKMIGKKIDSEFVELYPLNDGYVLQHNDVKWFFKPLDGKFPDVSRVIRDVYLSEDLRVQQIMINLEYLALCQKVNKVLKFKAGTHPLMTFNGQNGAILMNWEQDENAKLALMPIRQKVNY